MRSHQRRTMKGSEQKRRKKGQFPELNYRRSRRREEMGGITTAPTNEGSDNNVRQNSESLDLDELIEENAETLKTSTDLLSSQMSVELLLLQIPRKVHSLLGRGLHKYVEQIYRKTSGIQMK